MASLSAFKLFTFVVTLHSKRSDIAINWILATHVLFSASRIHFPINLEPVFSTAHVLVAAMIKCTPRGHTMLLYPVPAHHVIVGTSCKHFSSFLKATSCTFVLFTHHIYFAVEANYFINQCNITAITMRIIIPQMYCLSETYNSTYQFSDYIQEI